MATTSDVALEPRGPQIAGSVSMAYVLAANLWRAAHDHKKYCTENCNVSVSRIRDAAKVVMSNHVTLREDRDFQKWVWPS
jgi:hypothetical protein